jgi:hypothetical protein
MGESAREYARRPVCDLPLHAADHLRPGIDFLSVPALCHRSRFSEISAAACAALRGIRVRRIGRSIRSEIASVFQSSRDLDPFGARWNPRDERHCARCRHGCNIPASGSLAWRKYAGESACHRCDSLIRYMSGCRAPGLEQKHSLGTLGRGGFHRPVWRRSGVGSANVVLVPALISLTAIEGN